MSETCLNHIGGAWVPALSGTTFEDRNPARPEEVIAEVARNGPADVDAAVTAAEAARAEWAATPAWVSPSLSASCARHSTLSRS